MRGNAILYELSLHTSCRYAINVSNVCLYMKRHAKPTGELISRVVTHFCMLVYVRIRKRVVVRQFPLDIQCFQGGRFSSPSHCYRHDFFMQMLKVYLSKSIHYINALPAVEELHKFYTTVVFYQIIQSIQFVWPQKLVFGPDVVLGFLDFSTFSYILGSIYSFMMLCEVCCVVVEYIHYGRAI